MLIFVSAEKFKNSPSARNMPNGIKKEAIPVWKYITKRLGKKIQEGSNLKEQWAIAVIMFKNICTKKGIMPFDFETLQKQQDEKITDIYTKIKNSSKKSKRFVKKLLDSLIRDKFLEKPKKPNWIFDKTIYANGRYHIAVYKRLKLDKDTSVKDLMIELSKHKFSKKPDSAFFTVDSNTTISFELDKKDNIYLYITLSFIESEAQKLTEKEKGKKLENKLTRIGKELLS